jgi:Sec-independent protein translocase protein TatA
VLSQYLKAFYPEPHNKYVLKLLYLKAHWHRLAKLQLHTDATLDMLDGMTTSLGHALREFQKYTCSAFETQELQKEMNARKCKQAKKSKPANNTSNEGHQLTVFNLNTYKHHSLGDVVGVCFVM